MLYVSRTERGRGLIGCKMSVKAEKNSLECYVNYDTEPSVVAVGNSNTVPSANLTQTKKV